MVFMPVCTLVVDIWLCCRAEHLANSVLIQCCGREHYNSQSPLAHRSNCIICSTGVIAHTSWSPALWASTQVYLLMVFVFEPVFHLHPSAQTGILAIRNKMSVATEMNINVAAESIVLREARKIMVSWVCLDCCFKWITSLRIKVISIRGTGSMMAFLYFYPLLFLM